MCRVPNPVAVRPKAYICGISIASIAGLGPTENMDIRLLCLLCVV